MEMEEYLKLLQDKAIPLQEEKIVLLEKMLEILDGEKSDTTVAEIKLKERHVKVIANRILEIEMQMNS